MLYYLGSHRFSHYILEKQVNNLGSMLQAELTDSVPASVNNCCAV